MSDVLDVNSGHRVSREGLLFIGRWEGFRAQLYNDALGHCTIGYGHLVHRGHCNGSEPARFRRGLTNEQALELLREDAASHAAVVNVMVHVPLAQHQFDALASFVYNVGSGAFSGSTLLRKLNQGNYGAVPGELMRWTNNGMPGLVRRRRAEGALFRDEHYLADVDEGAGAPEQGRDTWIAEGPEAPTDEVPSGDEGPADGDQHGTVGDRPSEIGVPTDEPDSPPPPGTGELTAGDRLQVAMTVGVDMGLVITSTTGGRHGKHSYHYSKPYRTVVIHGRRYEVGRAADVAKAGNPDALYRAYFHRIEAMRPTELFYTPMGYSWKDGHKVGWTVPGHFDHVHVAF